MEVIRNGKTYSHNFGILTVFALFGKVVLNSFRKEYTYDMNNAETIVFLVAYNSSENNVIYLSRYKEIHRAFLILTIKQWYAIKSFGKFVELGLATKDSKGYYVITDKGIELALRYEAYCEEWFGEGGRWCCYGAIKGIKKRKSNR